MGLKTHHARETPRENPRKTKRETRIKKCSRPTTRQTGTRDHQASKRCQRRARKLNSCPLTGFSNSSRIIRMERIAKDCTLITMKVRRLVIRMGIKGAIENDVSSSIYTNLLFMKFLKII